MVTAENNISWGRVDEDGTVYVRESDGERAVGQYPDSTPEEALAYFARKFEDLEGQVTLLEARIARGTATGNVTESVAKLQAQLETPTAVGDIESLRTRVTKLTSKANEFSEQQRQEREQAKQEALAERERIAAEAEALRHSLKSRFVGKISGKRFRTCSSNGKILSVRGHKCRKLRLMSCGSASVQRDKHLTQRAGNILLAWIKIIKK